MKKSILSLILAFSLTVIGYGQISLPTHLGFDGQVIPSGWTTNPSAAQFYTATSVPNPPALKLTSTGHYIIGELAGTPGQMTYDLTGNPSPGNPWTGSFQVLESADGTTYTLVKEHTGTNGGIVEQIYTPYTVQLDESTRFVKFLFATKTSGNIGLDNINIQPGAASQQEMKVVVNGNNIVPQEVIYTNSDANTTTNIPFILENVGTGDDLIISDIEITGVNAAEYALTNEPTSSLTIAGLASSAIGIDFTPTSAGTKTAKVTITSNDIDYPVFEFYLEGYGDGIATEPTEQPSALSFSNIKTFRIQGSFTASSDADGYIILRKVGSAVTGTPEDGTIYKAGDIIGDAKVVKVTSGTSFTPNDIIAGTDYHFVIFAFNGTGSGINYLTTSPLSGNQATPANTIPASDYQNIDVEDATLISDLHDVTSPHYQNYYADYALRLVENFYARDTTNGKRVLTCQYSGKQYQYNFPFSFGGTGMSREHTFASSWFPISDNEANFYSDYHNLLLLNQDDANAIRSNYPLGRVVSDTIQARGDSYFGKNAEGQWVYEPRDETKGTAARAMFYMCVRYTEGGVTWKLPSYISSSISYGQDQDLLKEWNLAYPPTNQEIARNDFIDSLQNNRNPFIDHPEYACYIDFSNMTYLADGCSPTLDVKPFDLEKGLTIYPNPAKNNVTIATVGTEITGYSIYNMEGRLMSNDVISPVFAKEVNVENLSQGMYLINVQTNSGEITKKIIVE